MSTIDLTDLPNTQKRSERSGATHVSNRDEGSYPSAGRPSSQGRSDAGVFAYLRRCFGLLAMSALLSLVSSACSGGSLEPDPGRGVTTRSTDRMTDPNDNDIDTPGGGAGAGVMPTKPIGGSDDSGGGSALSCDAPQVPVMASRRLTNAEYDRTLRDLFPGLDIGRPSIDNNFPADVVHHHFFNNNAKDGGIVRGLAAGYLAAATNLSGLIEPKLEAITGCPVGVSESNNGIEESHEACIQTFIQSFGYRAFRRPLEDAEKDRLFEFYEGLLGEMPEAEARLGLVERILVAPQFLYRYDRYAGTTDKLGANEDSEATTATDIRPLDAHSLASRLSYLVAGTMPDSELFEAAKNNELGTIEQIRTHAKRLLKTPEAKQVVESFFAQLTETDFVTGKVKDPELFPEFDGETATAMREQARAFAQDVFFDPADDPGSGMSGWERFMTGKKSFANSNLARHMGWEIDTDSSEELVAVDLPQDKAAGVFTLGAVLTNTSKPDRSDIIFRGKWVSERLLCWVPPDVPLGIPDAPPPEEGLTNREISELHMREEGCWDCHKHMDRIGYTLEHYDAAGRYRDTDNGLEIDAKGVIVETGDADGEYDGAIELAEGLAKSEYAQNCMAKKMFTFMTGRSPNRRHDRCSLDRLTSTLVETGSFEQALLAYLETDAFRYGRLDP